MVESSKVRFGPERTDSILLTAVILYSEQSRETCNQHNNTVEDLDRRAHNR